MKHPWMKMWCRGEEFLIKKVIHLTHKENIEKVKQGSVKKTKEAITSIADTVRLRASQYSIGRSQG